MNFRIALHEKKYGIQRYLDSFFSESYRDDLNEIFEDSEHYQSSGFEFPRKTATGAVFKR